MIGRDQELRRLRELAAVGASRVALLAGEPGIGKTRLVQELLGGLPAATQVLLGHAEPESLARPYEVLLDALGAGPGAFPADDPELLVVTDQAAAPVERLHAGLAVVERLLGDVPAVIVFEDLHWIDSESAALFERLADRDAPQLLVGTYRPDEITNRHPLAGLLARLERRHAVTHLRLSGLHQADTAALLASVAGRPVPHRSAAVLYDRTGGNPFFLEELLRGCEGGDPARLGEQPLPWSLAEVLRRQVDELPPVGRRVAEAAAVLGHRVPFDLFTAVTGTDESALVEALRELVERGLLVESGPDEFAFRHALVREALTSRMLGRERRRLHETALEALLASGDPDPALVAHHAHGAGRYQELVDAARRGAPRYLEMGSAYQALQLAELGLAEAGDDLALLAAATRSAWLAGLGEEAVEYARQWRRLATAPAERVDALTVALRLAWEADEVAEMVELTEQLAQLLPDLPAGPERARALTALAESSMLRGSTEAAVAWADAALELAASFELPRVRLAASVEKGCALMMQPHTRRRSRELLTAVAAESEHRREWTLAARACYALLQLGPDPAAGDEQAALTGQAGILARMGVAAERANFESLLDTAFFQARAQVAIREGDLPAAIAALQEGRSRDRGYQVRGRRAHDYAVFLAGLYLEAGELDRVAELAAPLATSAARDRPALPGIDFHLACRRGDLAAAERYLDELLALRGRGVTFWGQLAHDLVSAGLAVGVALPRLRQLVGGGDSQEDQRRLMTLVEAQLAEAAGEPATALAGFRAVAELPTGPPPVRGVAHTGAARCLLVLGEKEAALGHAEAATTALARWGGWRVAQLAQLRAQLGMMPSAGPAAPTGPAALTAREREVAVLVADGLTNAELARRLYISPRTAAVHVSHILRKLEVGSRTEVAAVLRPG
ncbi:AAA family ATPase [Natronosporangium hydrolyticum]|uniref:AAA family ATPase n=2 Tax=Natronosporangium hydrolyticum TaxID=2811111 RepID=A0A895YN32_9ACTN|nr:AAA family ATPase [Natronosporangium hydrolyticum]